MNKGKHTVSSIADALGVSRASVSRALNNSPGVGTELRKQILEYAEQIGYKTGIPSPEATTTKSNVIGLVFGDIQNPFYSDLAYHVQKTLNEHGYSVIIFNSEYDPEKAAECLKEAGYENGEGLPELNIYTSVGFYPKTKEYYEYIAACLQAVGINCKVVPLDTSSWGDVLYEETPCYMIDCGWQPSGIEPELKLNSWYAAGRISHYEPTAELQDIMDRFATETDPDKRKQILQDEYLPALAEEMPDIPIIKSMTIFGVRSNVKGLEYTSGADYIFTNVTKE